MAFQGHGLFTILTILSLITSVNGVIYPSLQLSVISFSLIKSSAFILFFHQPNFHSVKLFIVTHLSHFLMKLSGTFGKTRNNMNVQYDIYKNTKEVLKAVRSEQEMKLQNDLISQGWFFSIISPQSMLKVTSAWSSVQCKLPKNTFNGTVKYIIKTLPARSILHKWGL